MVIEGERNGSRSGWEKQTSPNGIARTGSMSIDYPKVPRLQLEPQHESHDEGTPDSWITRDKRLVKLTGKHPHNVEAPLSLLFDQGFLTPQNLFFVRSHGAVPKIDASRGDSWSVTISGMVKRPTTFTVAELKANFEVVTLPITLVCAGNRRREQNVVQKGLGFNWGAAGVSTALWTGVYLADILDYVQPESSADGKHPRHVIFESADGEQLPQGPYGTSQPLSHARSRSSGILVSWSMNSEPLEPDHGFPLRIVVPGRIGGRSVKWLQKIEVSHMEAQHHLHFFDNKLIPTEVGPSQARDEERWWRDPRYIIQDLNVNSAIARPAHDEILSGEANAEDDYHIRGYAYSGGGRRVTRVEVSMDEGETWRLSDVEYPEDKYRQIAFDGLDVYGRLDLTDRDESFCWCFWSFGVKVAELQQASSIQVRAMDESLALQPRDMYWNATSMMNNWWFRVAIHVLPTNALRFEHPTLPGTQAGGWMQRMKDAGEDILKPTFRASRDELKAAKFEVLAKPKIVKDDVVKCISDEELRSTERTCFVVEGQVYDATDYLDEHPGGVAAIDTMKGQDATEDFFAIHSTDALEQLAQFHIAKFTSTRQSLTSTPDSKSLPTSAWIEVRLHSVVQVSHDSRLYRFTLPLEHQSLPLVAGQHIYVRLPLTFSSAQEGNGSLSQYSAFVQRAYTPISPLNALGYLELLIKLYRPCDKFPSGGRMSTCFNELKVGDSIEIKGPLGSFNWLGNGSDLCRWNGVERSMKKIGMICGGSGVTPIIQVLRAILEDDRSKVHVKLLDANKTEQDIWCREELDTLQYTHPERFDLQYTLSAPPAGWTHSKGQISMGMLQTFLPSSGPPESLILICGPDGMVKACKSALVRIGWDPSQLVIF